MIGTVPDQAPLVLPRAGTGSAKSCYSSRRLWMLLLPHSEFRFFRSKVFQVGTCDPFPLYCEIQSLGRFPSASRPVLCVRERRACLRNPFRPVTAGQAPMHSAVYLAGEVACRMDHLFVKIPFLRSVFAGPHAGVSSATSRRDTCWDT